MNTCLLATRAALLLILMTAPVFAQDRPTVFIHGLNSTEQTWAATATRLAADVQIAAHLPNPAWRSTFETQAAQVQAAVGSLPGSTIAIGHSNGGLVAREWSRSRPLSGIVTLGTPHGGTPLIGNIAAYTGRFWQLHGAQQDAMYWFSLPMCYFYGEFYYCHLNNILGRFVGEMWYVDALHGSSLLEAILTVGMDTWTPVVPQMVQGSPYLTGLNSASNVSREAAHVPTRLGIVSEAHNWYWGGPIRVRWSGEKGDEYARLRDWVRGATEYFGWYLLTHPEQTDSAQYAGDALIRVSNFLGEMDQWWCESVTYAPRIRGMCQANDSILPVWSQDYSAAGAHRIIVSDGPTHIKETADGYPWLYQALTAYAGIPPRGSSTSPPPPSSGSMVVDAAIRGCSNYSESGPVYQASASACLSHCQANNASACEWQQSTGGCWVEYGVGCYVEAGFAGWHAGIVKGDAGVGSGGTSGGTTGTSAVPMQASSAVRGCSNYSELAPVHQADSNACSAYCAQKGANACEWEQSTGGCWAEFGQGCRVEGGFGGWWAVVFNAPAPDASTDSQMARAEPGSWFPGWQFDQNPSGWLRTRGRSFARATPVGAQ